ESVGGAGAHAGRGIVDRGTEVSGRRLGAAGVELEPAGSDRGLARSRRAGIALEERDEGGERGVGAAGATERARPPEARVLGGLARGVRGAGEGGRGGLGIAGAEGGEAFVESGLGGRRRVRRWTWRGRLAGGGDLGGRSGGGRVHG